ncbi:CDAN1-interacting nuclease 1 [Eupeodes corollae]|uniref:CDAN1-interacting nuclease 1 n=1 Tax=Eupeodes corollae TaxID=290404 RepID=UPI0024902616|nr:CDAN1-interacting nuclease 1 [Eupeodes corollae]
MTDTAKKTILNHEQYSTILDFIHNYRGLAIDCELEMEQRFPEIHRQTLKSILVTEMGLRTKIHFSNYQANAVRLLRIFEDKSAHSFNNNILIDIACSERMSPVILCRIILQERYKDFQKSDIAELMKKPNLIEDEKLAGNVRQCTLSDNQEGPVVDIRRRCLGEEYEVKLKKMATDAKMAFFDENDLRRTGFDKTPDLKLVLPCLYKGCVVNWIESKALFGDAKTHRRYLYSQLSSYSNRFGPGIVIYWFGYHEEIVHLKENGPGLIILADFPSLEHLEFLNT